MQEKDLTIYIGLFYMTNDLHLYWWRSLKFHSS